MTDALLECLFDGVLAMNADGCIQRANDAACRILGASPDDIVGRRIQEIVLTEYRPPHDGAAPPPPGGVRELTLARRDGSLVEVMARECTGATAQERMWILRDPSSDAHVTEKLERQSRLLMEAQRVGHTGAWELDLKTGLAVWSLELRRIMEVPESTETMTIEQTFRYYSNASEAIVREAFNAAVTRGIPYDLELEAVTARGKRIWVREVCRATLRDGRLVSVIGVLQDITERRRLATFLANVADEERARIGADLHDGLGQELTGLALLLESLAMRSKRDGPSLTGDLRNLAQLASNAVASVRDLAHGMLPLALREGDFERMLLELANSTRRAFGVGVTVRVRGGKTHSPTGRIAENLFRIAQEATTNAVKHGRARQVTIDVRIGPKKLSVAILDDGVGFDGTGSNRGMGLQIMHHRARSLGGLLEVRRPSTGGIRICCVVPRSEAGSAKAKPVFDGGQHANLPTSVET